MGLEPITSRVRTERTAARSPRPHGQHGGNARIRTGDLERDKLAGTAGLPYVSTTQISGGLGCWPRRARLMRPCCALARPRATHRDAENFREGKNSGLVLLRNLRDARASPLQR